MSLVVPHSVCRIHSWLFILPLRETPAQGPRPSPRHGALLLPLTCGGPQHKKSGAATLPAFREKWRARSFCCVARLLPIPRGGVTCFSSKGCGGGGRGA